MVLGSSCGLTERSQTGCVRPREVNLPAAEALASEESSEKGVAFQAISCQK